MRNPVRSGAVATMRTAVAVSALVVSLFIAACNSPTVPTIPPTQAPGSTPVPTASVPASSAGVTPTPGGSGPTVTPGVGSSPTASASAGGSGPCRLLTADEVNAALGPGFGAGTVQGTSCLFNGSGVGTAASLVSVSVSKGDTITPIRSRYPDLEDLTLDAGVAEWSAGVGTCWLVVDGPRTVVISILGTALTGEGLSTAALQLAQMAAGRI